MKKTEKYLGEMKAIFANTRDKHEANYQSTNLMAEISGDAEFFSEILQKHLEKTENLNTLHYPVVGIDIELNEYFGLVANCWIPLPDKSTNICEQQGAQSLRKKIEFNAAKIINQFGKILNKGSYISIWAQKI